MKKALIILAVLIVAVAGVAIWYARQPRRTPRGQPALESITSATLSDFQEAFNRSPSSVRMVLLLSPT
jgi:hypothetical protein